MNSRNLEWSKHTQNRRTRLRCVERTTQKLQWLIGAQGSFTIHNREHFSQVSSFKYDNAETRGVRRERQIVGDRTSRSAVIPSVDILFDRFLKKTCVWAVKFRLYYLSFYVVVSRKRIPWYAIFHEQCRTISQFPSFSIPNSKDPRLINIYTTPPWLNS